MLETEELFILSLLKRTVEISLYWSIHKPSLNTPFIGRRATAAHLTSQQACQDSLIRYCHEHAEEDTDKRLSSQTIKLI